ncbi:MAG: protoporphyrinogen oxidase, partial [Deltaproteobacteria bacterium]
MKKIYDTIIVGGGLSGLCTASRLNAENPKHNLIILEKNQQAGGCIQTHHEQGYIAEIGPHGFLDNCDESKSLMAEAGLDREVVTAPLIDFVRYVYLNGKLNLIPQTPLKIIKAPLIPWPDKFRVLLDLFRPPLEGQPTVAKWVEYRFGKAILPYMDAALTGTYAGDYERLKIDAVMPGVRNLERKHGSVIKGAMARIRAARKKNNRKKLSMPAMTSFPKGMQYLTDKLAKPFAESGTLQTGVEAVKLEKADNFWQVEAQNGQVFQAANLAVALPVNKSLPLIKQIDHNMPVEAIPEARIVTVVFGYGPEASLPPGFGFLVPESEKRFILGTLFSSNMFPGRAPDGHIVFETFIGGRRHPERAELDDQELIMRAEREVTEILDLPGKPLYSKVLRTAWGIPQLEDQAAELLAWKKSLEARE